MKVEINKSTNKTLDLSCLIDPFSRPAQNPSHAVYNVTQQTHLDVESVRKLEVLFVSNKFPYRQTGTQLDPIIIQ